MTIKFRIDYTQYDLYGGNLESYKSNDLFNTIEEAKEYAIKNYFNMHYPTFWITKIVMDEATFFYGEEKVTVSRGYDPEKYYIKKNKEKIIQFKVIISELEISKIHCKTDNKIIQINEKIKKLQEEIKTAEEAVEYWTQKSIEIEKMWNNTK